jgi:tRNA(adenine34) deaminase
LLDLYRIDKQAMSMTLFDNTHMKRALDAAQLAAENGEVPVGAVLVHHPTNKVVIAVANKIVELKDPTAHAEILAIRAACTILNNERLSECDLYVTLEPCPMCAQAISFARIRRLYYSASDKKGGGVENGPLIFNASSCHHKPEVYSGIMEKQAAEILRNFFKKRR